MRFDDTLETVLAGDLGTPFGMQSAWRQLVDLIGRRRVPPDTRALAVLRRIRAHVPPPVRQASARGLEHAHPPAPLVRLFAMDDLPIALPVLRSARMASADWIQLLPDLSPAGRAVLRNRRDLSPIVRRALESYGPIDFVLPDQSRRHEVVAVVEPEPVVEAAPEPKPEPEPVAAVQPEPQPLVGVQPEPKPEPEPVAAVQPEPQPLVGVQPEPEPEPVVAIQPEPEPVAEIPAPILVPEPPAPPQPAERLVDWTDVLATPVPEPTPLRLAVAPPVDPATLVVAAAAVSGVSLPVGEAAPAAPAPLEKPEIDLSFVALVGDVSLPNAAEPGPVDAAPVQSGTQPVEEPIAQPPEPAQQSPMASLDTVLDPPAFSLDEEHEGPFEIAEVVARIDAFWRNREENPDTGPRPPATPAEHFRFETDAKGVVRWVDGVSRAPIVGLSLDQQAAGVASGPRVDGVAAGAFRRRAGFSNARLEVDGDSDAAGGWLISAIPVFDPANGRFTGYRGTARRPRADERAEPNRAAGGTPADSLRQLVHELRTPTNAIAGFAEMIEAQMLGPVADPYRERATVIRGQARDLLGAIDDLDLAARIDSAALSLAAGRVPLRPLFAGIAEDLAQLSALRGSWIALPIEDFAVHGDRRAVERLLARLMATFVSASAPGERIGVRTSIEADSVVAIAIDRPVALSDYPGDALLAIDDEGGDATLLGTGFALRLARNLARELGGSLAIGAESLTLRLPASDNASVGQAHLS